MHCFAGNVVPQRLGFGVLHHEERIVEAGVDEVMHRAVDRRDQTDPAIHVGYRETLEESCDRSRVSVSRVVTHAFQVSVTG